MSLSGSSKLFNNQTLISGTAWTVLGAMVSRAVALSTNICIARILGKHLFGEVSVIQVTAATLGGLAGYGINQAITKFVAELQIADSGSLGQTIRSAGVAIIIIGSIAASLLLAFSDQLSLYSLQGSHGSLYLRYSSVYLLATIWIGYLNSTFAGLRRFREIAICNLTNSCICFVTAALGAVQFGATGAIIGFGVGNLVNCYFTWNVLRRVLKSSGIATGSVIGIKSHRRQLYPLLRFALPMTLGGSLVGPVQWVCLTILVRRSMDGYGEAAIYNAANQWFIAAMYIPSLVGQVLLPVIIEYVSRADRYSVGRLLVRTSLANFAVVSVVSVISWRYGKLLMSLFGREFSMGGPVAFIMLTTAGLLSLQSCVGQLVIAINRPWLGLIMNLGWSMVYIYKACALAPTGAVGLAQARFIAYAWHLSWTAVFALGYVYGWFVSKRSPDTK